MSTSIGLTCFSSRQKSDGSVDSKDSDAFNDRYDDEDKDEVSDSDSDSSSKLPDLLVRMEHALATTDGESLACFLRTDRTLATISGDFKISSTIRSDSRTR